jgi:hypothetical protein
VSWEVRNYILSAKMSSITGTNSIKV